MAARKNILIVDDSAFVRMGVQHYLEKHDCIVHEASGEADALYLFEQQKFDIAIVDISLQVGPNGKEGLGLARKMKTRAPEMGVILLSGSPSYYQEFLEISRKHRGIAYVYKGNNFRDELLSVMEQVVKGGIWVSPEVSNYKNAAAVSLSDTERVKIDCILCFFNLLSSREREIVRLLAASYDNEAIAKQLFLSPNTVSSHLSTIYSKVGLGENLSRSEKRLLLAKACLLNQAENN